MKFNIIIIITFNRIIYLSLPRLLLNFLARLRNSTWYRVKRFRTTEFNSRRLERKILSSALKTLLGHYVEEMKGSAEEPNEDDKELIRIKNWKKKNNYCLAAIKQVIDQNVDAIFFSDN
jgi:hypothetical protein